MDPFEQAERVTVNLPVEFTDELKTVHSSHTAILDELKGIRQCLKETNELLRALVYGPGGPAYHVAHQEFSASQALAHASTRPEQKTEGSLEENSEASKHSAFEET